jgi:hypothetical protein
MSIMQMMLAGSYRRINLTVAANTRDYNIFTQAGSPATDVDVYVTVNSGIIIGSTSTATPALTTGSGWTQRSRIFLINNGTIMGRGGAGGIGGSNGNGFGGSAGGTAIDLTKDITITNNSAIYGGGGGGGGGGASGSNAGGGGGGGGAGDIGGTGAAGGTPSGNAGAAGTSSGPGNGGAGLSWSQSSGGKNPVTTSGVSGAGGNGGSFGAAGSSGTAATGDGTLFSGSGGGAAGKAINLNGYTATFTTGGTNPNVLGAIS